MMKRGDDINSLTTDSVVYVKNAENRAWLAWRAHNGEWDVLTPAGDVEIMTSSQVVGLGNWEQLK